MSIVDEYHRVNSEILGRTTDFSQYYMIEKAIVKENFDRLGSIDIKLLKEDTQHKIKSVKELFSTLVSVSNEMSENTLQ